MSNHVGLPIIFLKKIMIWLGIKIKNNLIYHLINVIDIIEFNQNLSTKEKKVLCEKREGYFEKFGGMNVLDSN